MVLSVTYGRGLSHQPLSGKIYRLAGEEKGKVVVDDDEKENEKTEIVKVKFSATLK